MITNEEKAELAKFSYLEAFRDGRPSYAVITIDVVLAAETAEVNASS